MATNISTLSVKLTATASAFASTMKGAANHVTSLGSSVLSTGSKIAGFAAGLTALAAGGSLLYLTHQSMEAIDANAKLSDRLGLTTESLAGLQHAGALANVSNEQLTGSLEKMLKALGGAADDGEDASNAFTKLGLDAKKLANLPTDQAFAAIADKISKIENPAERAAAAVSVFGKSGQSLLPLLMTGAEGIKAAQEEAEKLGLSFNRIDAAKVEQANDAITRVRETFTGVSNQIAIGLAPYIDAAATKFVELATAGGGIGPKVSGAIEWVTKAIATATDYANLLPVAFYGFRAGALQSIAGVIGGIDWLGSSIVKLINLIPGVNVAWTDTLSNLKSGLEKEAGEQAGKMNEALAKFQRGDNATAVTKLLEDIRTKSTQAAQVTADNAAKMHGAFSDIEDSSKSLKKVGDMLADLQKSVAQFGLTDAQKKIDDLTTLGASPEQIVQASNLLKIKEQLDAIGKVDTGDALTDFASKMEKLQTIYAQGLVTAQQFEAIRQSAKQTLTDKLTNQAKQITDDVKTPLEQYQEQIGKLNELLDRGLITKETFDRAKLKAATTFQSTANGAQPAQVNAIRAGSAESLKLAFESTRGVQRMTKDDIAKKQLDEQKDANRYLERIARGVETQQPTTLEVVNL